MGITAALYLTVGISTLIFNMFKVAIACATLAVALAAPEADPHYGYAPVLYNAYPNWPGVSTPYSSSTCFGCRGKRSAEPGYYGYGLPYFGGYHYGPGIAGHPGAATSYVARSPRVLARGPLMLRLTPTPLMLVTDSPTAAPLMPPTPFTTLPCTTSTATDTTIKLLLALG